MTPADPPGRRGPVRRGIQLLEFPTAQAVAEFMADGRRQALADERDRAIARTEVIDVQLVGGDPGA